MRSRIPIKGYVRPSVRPSVTHELKPCKIAIFDQLLSVPAKTHLMAVYSALFVHRAVAVVYFLKVIIVTVKCGNLTVLIIFRVAGISIYQLTIDQWNRVFYCIFFVLSRLVSVLSLNGQDISASFICCVQGLF